MMRFSKDDEPRERDPPREYFPELVYRPVNIDRIINRDKVEKAIALRITEDTFSNPVGKSIQEETINETSKSKTTKKKPTGNHAKSNKPAMAKVQKKL